MKCSLLCLFAALTIHSLFAVGCSDEMESKNDLSTPSPGPDMSIKACTMTAAWPSDDILIDGRVADSQTFDWVTAGYAFQTTGTRVDALIVEIWHSPTTPANPRTVSLPSDGNYTTCAVCVLLAENYSLDSFPKYFARGGMVTITKADTTPGAGMYQVSGSNIQFVEWDIHQDMPVPGGDCYEVGSFSIAGSYSNADM